jgi:hypothetical protein
LIPGVGQGWFEWMVQVRFRNNPYVMLRESARCSRVLSLHGCEEMLGKVGLRTGGYSAAAHMSSDGGEHEGEEAENRDGKEDIHMSQ